MDFVGFISFIVAAVYAFKNNAKLGFRSLNVWIYMGAASILASAWCLNFIFEDLNIKIPFVDESVIFFGVCFLFMVVAVGSRADFIKPSGFSRKK